MDIPQKIEKMKFTRFNLWMGILALIFLSSCRENIVGDGDSNSTTNEPVVLVETEISGRVISEAGAPLQDVLVEIEGESVFTDQNGFFSFQGDYNQNGTYIKATRNGFFLGAKVVNPNVGTRSFTQIELLSMDLTGSFASSAGGEITTSDGAAVNFTANSIVDANGNAYSGTVDVFVKWIDPSNPQIDDEMPGDLRAIDSDEANVQLATYGMLAVELRGNAGQELNLADNQEADITIPLPAELVGNAPSSIPLWSFNEDTGYWEEEGSAELVGGSYVGSVPHFSFWNCDAPFDLVTVTGTVESSNGQPLNFLKVRVAVDGIGCRYGYLDSDGNFGGKMPKNQILNIAIIDHCGNVIFEQDFGPYTEDTDIGTISVPGVSTSSISGRLVNCLGNAVTNGYVIIEFDNFSINLNVNELGEFESTNFFCSTGDVVLRGFDLDEILTSDPIMASVPGNTDVGDIEVCDVITEFIKVTVADPFGETFFFTNLSSGYDGDYYFVGAEQDSSFISFGLSLPPGVTGPAEVLNIQFFVFDNSNPNGLGAACDGGCNGAMADITINNVAEGRVQGSLTAELIGQGTPSFDVTIEWDLIE